MLLLIPNGALSEDHTSLSVTEFPMRSPLAKYLTSSLYQSMGSWVPTSPQIKTRDEETKDTNHVSKKIQFSHDLDAHNCCEVSPQPASREDYSLITNRSEIENIMQNT